VQARPSKMCEKTDSTNPVTHGHDHDALLSA
jgi:hypothetical protein